MRHLLNIDFYNIAFKKGTLEKVHKQVVYFDKHSTEELLALRNHAFKSSKETVHWKMALNQVLKERGIDVKTL
jgi:hypothetical protein